MRIISGKFGGRRLKALPGANTRPTMDKVKEAMFNMLGPYFDGGQVLDLYGGSGGLAIEAVSRGCAHAIICDQNFGAVQVIKENVAVTKETEAFDVWKMPAKKALARLVAEKKQFDYIFLDPPYAKQTIVEHLNYFQAHDLLAPEAVIVCETDQNVDLPAQVGACVVYKKQRYGITAVTMYQLGGK